MKFITNSTETETIGINEHASVVVLSIKDHEDGLALYVRIDGILSPAFEVGTPEELLAYSAAIIEAWE